MALAISFPRLLMIHREFIGMCFDARIEVEGQTER